MSYLVSLDCQAGEMRRYARKPGGMLKKAGECRFPNWPGQRMREGGCMELIQMFRKYGIWVAKAEAK